MDKEIELLPCPFCGGEAIIERDFVIERCSYRIYVRCNKCLTRVLHHATPEEAIKFWNIRHQPSGVDNFKLREALRQLYESVDSCLELFPNVMNKAKQALEETK